MWKVMVICGLAVSGLLAGPRSAAATPSFDCRKAATVVEETLCSVPMLGDLDRAVAGAYQARRAGLGPAGRQQLLDSQRAWIARRDACGGDVDCLARAMRARVAALTGQGQAAPAGWSGVYCARDGLDTLVLLQDGATLTVSLMSIQGGMHQCGLSLPMYAAGDHWQGTEMGCQVSLRAAGGAIDLTAVPEAACQQFCGARARLSGLTWPRGSKRPDLPLSVETICPNGLN